MTILNDEYVKRLADSGDTIDITNFGIRSTGEVAVNKFDGTSEALLVITTDYTINADLDTITLNSALTAGERAVATLAVDDTQLQAFRLNGANNAEKLETSLDKIWLSIKKKQELLDRVLAKQLSDTVRGLVFSSFEDKADFFAKVNTGETYVDFESLGGATFWKDYTLPAGDGNADEILYTDGAGTLAWADPSLLGTFKLVAKVVYDMVGADQIVESHNVTSVTQGSDANGEYFDISLTTAAITSNYLVLGWYGRDVSAADSGYVTMLNSDSKTTSSCRVRVSDQAGNMTTSNGILTLLFIK